MTCIRGEGQRIISAQAGDMAVDARYDLGDLPGTNWDALLKAIRQEYREERTVAALPFDQRIKRFDEAMKAVIDSGIPGSELFVPTGQKTGKEVIESFLKMRAGETAEQYAGRMAHWWVAGNPDLMKRWNMLMERGCVERVIARAAVFLAEYRSAHGAYPESLAALGEPVPRDPFSGKDIIYRREGAGYIHYSVGSNQTDDGGAGDDRPVRADR